MIQGTHQKNFNKAWQIYCINSADMLKQGVGSEGYMQVFFENEILGHMDICE